MRVSITAGRAKYFNISREPWAALHVTQDDFWAYVVLEGPAEVAPVAEAVDDPTVEELVTLYRNLAGEHPDWDDYRGRWSPIGAPSCACARTMPYGMLPSA